LGPTPTPTPNLIIKSLKIYFIIIEIKSV